MHRLDRVAPVHEIQVIGPRALRARTGLGEQSARLHVTWLFVEERRRSIQQQEARVCRARVRRWTS